MIRTIELPYDTVDKLIVDELKDIYLFNLRDKDVKHIEDIQYTYCLLSSIQTILDYFMSSEEKEEWSYKLQGAIVRD